jgi:MFS family permease
MNSSLNKASEPSSTLQNFTLCLGTFLEYFDLMLYTHMAVVLNDIFFFKSDPYNSQMTAVYSFCATFALKPLGALIFGKMGDAWGRTRVLFISMAIMAICCLVITITPTYAEIGVTASVIILVTRAIQGMSVVGESLGAEIYVAECSKYPARYTRVGLIGLSGVAGMVFALFLCKLMLVDLHSHWKNVFYVGFLISLVAAFLRINFRESKEYTDEARVLKKLEEDPSTQDDVILQGMLGRKVTLREKVSYMFVFFGWPICFYFSYVYCGSLLKSEFGFTKAEVIAHNFNLSIINFTFLTTWVLLTRFIHPLKTVLFKLMFLIPYIVMLPFLVDNCSSPSELLLIQSVAVVFGNSTIPSKAVFISYLPVLKRFSIASLYAALAHIVVYFFTSALLVYLTKFIGHKALWVIFGS